MGRVVKSQKKPEFQAKYAVEDGKATSQPVI